MKYIKTLLILYLLLKPYYIFSSGSLQLGDGVLLIAALLFFVITRFDATARKRVKSIVGSNRLLVIFVAITFIINGLYGVVLDSTDFVISSIYLLFNLIAVVIFSYFFKEKSFLENAAKALKFNLVVQLLVLACGLGSYYAGERYMGTFNDPNQFGFYILVSFLLVYILDTLSGKKKTWHFLTYLSITVFLILQSGSTGILLGMVTFLCLSLAYYLYKLRSSYSEVRKMIFTLLIIVVCVLPIGAAVYGAVTTRSGDSRPVILDRLDNKVSKSSTDESASLGLLEDRGYDIIYNYPAYVLFGAGQGGYDRYPESANGYEVEIHATFPALLFYYGIIPFAVLLRWIYKKLQGVDIRILIAVVALFVESFTLVNQRQSLFWLVIIASSAYVTGVYGKKVINRRKA